MFTQLLASRPSQQRSTTGLVASVGVHVAFVAAAVYLTLGAPPPVDASQTVVTPVYRPEPPTPAPPAPPQAPDTPPPGPPVVSVPIESPSSLPEIPPTLPAAPPELPPSTRFIPGAPAVAPTPAVAPGTPYRAEQVEVEVSFAPGTPMPRFPAALRAAGIEGSARFRFVVDTLGRVELATAERVESTHEAFALAVRESLSRLRFRPARVDGRPVRQLVDLPIAFRITR